MVSATRFWLLWGWYPIGVTRKLPDELVDCIDTTLMCYTQGGSRLWIAQKHNLDIPVIITDYIGKYEHGELIENTIDAMKYFTDKPKELVFGGKGLAVKNLPNFHMENEDV